MDSVMNKLNKNHPDNGIYVLAYLDHDKNIDSTGSNKRLWGALPIHITSSSGEGSYRLVGALQDSIDKQFKVVLDLLKNDIIENSSEALSYLDVTLDLGDKCLAGSSVGLGLFLGLVSGVGDIPSPCKLGVTGTVDKIGRLERIAGLQYKLEACLENNIPVVMIPYDNIVEAKQLFRQYPRLRILRILCPKTVIEAAGAFYQLSKYGISNEIH